MCAATYPLLRLFNIPSATIVHGLDITDENALYQRISRPALRATPRVIANSAATERIAVAAGLAPERVTVIRRPSGTLLRPPSPPADAVAAQRCGRAGHALLIGLSSGAVRLVAMETMAVEVQRLTKVFGAVVAVDDLTFQARRGEIVGLLGLNGAGKTTAIRLLSTTLAPTRGRFVLAGVDCTEPAEIRRRIGVLPESSGFPKYLTGHQYLTYHARLHGRRRADAERLAARLLAEVGLADRGPRRIATYSRGMRQRLGIARALANDPVVVLLDEPTLGLDPEGQRMMLAIVRRIAAERGAAVVLSSHTLPEVEQVCGQLLILSHGAVLSSGTVAEVTRQVASERSGRLRVPPELAGATRDVLAGVPGLRVETEQGRPDVLLLHSAGTDLNAALVALLAAEVPILAFEVVGARLDDAFAALTAREPR